MLLSKKYCIIPIAFSEYQSELRVFSSKARTSQEDGGSTSGGTPSADDIDRLYKLMGKNKYIKEIHNVLKILCLW